MNIELGYNAWGWNSEGYLTSDYYVDDVLRARATSVYTVDGVNYQNINSGVPGYAGVQNGRGTLGWGDITFDLAKNGGYVSNNISDFSSTPGNLNRTQKCRVRAVYRSGTGNGPKRN